MKKSVKSSILLMLAVLMLVSCVVGCAKQDASTADVPKDEIVAEAPAVENDETIVLEIAAFEGGNGIEYLQKICEAFEESHSNVTIELTSNPKIEEIIRPQMVAGDSPDVYYPGSEGNPFFRALLNEGQLMDLTDLFEEPGFDDDTPLKDQIVDGFLQSTACDPNQDGRILCAPTSICTRGMIYNKALFEEKGWEVPETWDEFFALGDKAKEEGYALMTYAGTYPEYLDTMIMPSLASALGAEKVQQLSQFQEGILTTPEAKQVFDNVAKIGQGGYLLEGTVGMNHTQSQSEFILNKCLFCPNGDWLANEMADAPHAEGFKYAIAPAPTLEKGQTVYTRSTPDIWTVPIGAKNPEMAKEFIRFLYSDEAVKLFALGSILQCTKDAATLTKGMFDEAFTSMHEIDAYATALVFNWRPDPDGSKIIMSEVVYNPISDVMTGKMSADEWRESIEAAFHKVNAGE